MKLTSMKMAKKDLKELDLAMGMDKDAPRYPYGLQLNLDTEALKKLGIEKLPSVGEKFVLTAEVEVISIHSHESLMGGDSKGMGLQITAMALGAEEGDTAKRIYGSK
jgi:hypothetical protein